MMDSSVGAISAIVPVAVQAFRHSMLDCDIYVRQAAADGMALYRKKGQSLDISDLDRLEKRGIHELFVSYADQESHRRSMAAEIGRDTTQPPEARFNLLREISRASFEAAYHSDDVDQVVGFVEELGPQLTDVLSDGDLVLPDLFT